MNFRPQPLLIIISLLIVLIGCTPPTPPPSPTPWPSATPRPVEVSPAPSPSSRPQTLPTPTPTPTVVSVATPSPTTITLWESLPEPQAQLLAQEVQAFQAEFPQYLVSLQHYDGPESFMTPLMTGEISFDVVLASPVLLGNLWAAEQIAPTADFFPPSFMDGFAAVTLLGASRDSKVWGLPDTTGFHLLLFYNRNLVDTPPANTTELFELAESLTGHGKWGLGVNSYDPLWLTPWLTPYGGWLTDEAGHPTLNTPAMEAAITLYLSWQGRLTGIAPVETYDEIRSRFLNGDMAMMISGEWAIGELARTSKVDWGVALLPNVGGSEESQPAAPLVLTRYWAISRTSTGNQALASTAFLEFITRPERQLAWTTQFGLLPTRREALNDPIIMNDSTKRVSAAQMQAGRIIPLGTNANLLLDAMREPLQGVIDGELTPQEAAAMMQANAER